MMLFKESREFQQAKKENQSKLEKEAQEKIALHQSIRSLIEKKEPVQKRLDAVCTNEEFLTAPRYYVEFLAKEDCVACLFEEGEKKETNEIACKKGERLIGKGSFTNENELFSLSVECSSFSGVYVMIPLENVHIIRVFQLSIDGSKTIEVKQEVENMNETFHISDEKIDYALVFAMEEQQGK